jgi:hypothetical protein
MNGNTMYIGSWIKARLIDENPCNPTMSTRLYLCPCIVHCIVTPEMPP